MSCCFGFLAPKTKVLLVRVLGAKGLRNTELGLFRRFGDCSDPYATVSIGGAKLRTATIENNLEPRWQEDTWAFALKDDDRSLEVEVFDCDLLTSDDLLGKAAIDIGGLEPGKKHTLVKSLGEGNGEVELEVELKSVDAQTAEEARKKTEALQRAQAGELGAAKSSAEAGAGTVLTVSVKQARSLRNTDRGLFRRGGDVSDPYALVSAGGQQLRTATIDNCLDPVWNSEEFSFVLGADDKSMKLQVYDSDLLTFDDILGELQLDLAPLAFSKWHELTQSLGQGNGEVQFRVRLERQAEQRLRRARQAREALEKEQAEQERLAKAAAAQGAGDVLTVAVVGASGLRNTDRGFFRRQGDCSDPYVQVKAGGKKLRTPTIDNDLNPVWNAQWFSFTLGDADQFLDLEVYDSDLLTFDDLLGKAQVDIKALTSGKWLERKESLGPGNGEIEFKVRLERQKESRVQKAGRELEEAGKQQEEELRAAKAKAEEGAGTILTVTVARASKLKNTDRGLFRRSGDASDPYAVVSAGGQSLRTEVIDNCLDPVWNSKEFSFTLGADDKSLKLQVYDSDLLTFDDLLGELQLDLAPLAFGKWHDLRQSLGAGCGEVEFRVRLEKQAQVRLQRAQQARAALEKQQAEQLQLAKSAAAQGAGDVLTVAVIGASGLRNTDRGLFRRQGDCSDPYAVVSAGGKKLRTSTIDNDLNPVWNSEWFSFTVGDSDSFLDFEVYDSDLLTFDDLLGKARIDVKSLTAGKWLDRKESLGSGNGEIEFKVRLEKQKESRMQKAESDRQKLAKQQEEELRAAKAKAEEGAGDILTVTVVRAAELRNTDRGLFRRSGDASDPYTVLSIGGQKVQTATINNCLNPVWDSQEFSFTLKAADGCLKVQVFDADLLATDELLGETSVDVKSLTSGEWVEQQRSLGEGNGAIELKLRLEKQGQQRLARAQASREKLVSEQEEQLKKAKAKAAQGAGDILTVAVVGASGLRNTDNGLFRRFGDCSDPYVMVSAGGKKLWTPTINNDLNPVWNSQWFSFTVKDTKTPLLLEVFDSDFLTSDELLGKASVDLAALPHCQWLDKKLSLGAGNGDIDIKLRLERQEAKRLDKAEEKRAELERQLAEERRAAEAAAASSAGLVLSVEVLKASGLRNTDRGLFRRSGDCSDPYAVVSAGGRKLWTKTIDNDLNPVWNSEAFSFTLGAAERSFNIEVFDSDLLTFDDSLGKVSVDIGKLATGKWLTQKESLGQGNGTIEFKVRLEKQAQPRLEKAQGLAESLSKQQEQQIAARKASAEKGAGRVVSVKVLGAHGLANTESRLTQMIGDKSDPYVSVTLGEAKLETRIVWNSLDPVWPGDVFSFPAVDLGVPLRLEVWDFDLFDPSDLLGKVELNLADIKAGEWVPFRRPLAEQPEGGKGELSFEVRVELQEQVRVEKAAQARDELEKKQQLEREQQKKEGEKQADKKKKQEEASGK